MEDDFYRLFYSNLKKQLGKEFADSVEELIEKNRFNKKSFMTLIKETNNE